MTFLLGWRIFRGDPKFWQGIPTKQGDLAVMNGNHETKRIRYDVFISGEQRISFFEGRSFNQNGGKMGRFLFALFWEGGIFPDPHAITILVRTCIFTR